MVVSGLLAHESRRRQPEVGADLARQFLTWDRPGFVASAHSVLVDRAAVLDALADVTVPSLIVSGRQDRTLPSIHSERIAAKLCNARHVAVPGAGHLVPLEAPGEANSLIPRLPTKPAAGVTL
jgi:pimeloyl-ACP methyl ester carboxylesterase